MIKYFEIKQEQERQQHETLPVLFLCDRKKCKKCSFPNCKHTTDIRHAKNFKADSYAFTEKER